MIRRIVAGALAVLLASCAAGTDGARQALTGADTFLAGATKSFETFDADWQKHLVEQAPTKDAANKALAEYRARRTVVVKVIVDAQAILASGPPLLALVDLGQKKSKDMTEWLGLVYDALAKVVTALKDLGVSIPSFPGGAS